LTSGFPRRTDILRSIRHPEIDKLMASAGEGRNLVRDRLLILMAFRHALRVSELVDIRWQQIHLDTATVDIHRAKNGMPGIHGLQGDELRLLRALRREHPHADSMFLSERKAPLSVDGAQKLIERLGAAAGARPLLIVHLEETRICIDVVCPQQLHHRLHVVGPIVFDIRGHILELAYIDCSGVRGARMWCVRRPGRLVGNTFRRNFKLVSANR
jgi:integrase